MTTNLLSLKNVSLPPSKTFPARSTTVSCQSSIVVIGANGAGKTRLGFWLESKGPEKERVHRIAAQRSLVFPEDSSPVGYEKALNLFHWAPIPSNWDEVTFNQNRASLRSQRRYSGAVNHAETAPVSDFDTLTTLLFSENYSALLTHEEQQRSVDTLVPMPETLLRIVQELWQQLLPHRKLRFTGSEVRVVHKEAPGKDYAAKALSDGERVIFYLIGQCICAPKNAIIVVDEPELHLHKAIQNTLWNALEKKRPDCTFVYLTHDLAFASDRTGATKICVTEFVDGAFSWFEVSEQNAIPNDILLEVLGSRKPVLFVEGTNGSLDLAIYRLIYPNFTVKPVGGCAAVIAATKAFKALDEFHHLRCFGIVDRDYLEQSQIQSYQRNGIYTPFVSEIENIFLVPDVITAVANQLLLDPVETLNQVKQFVMEDFERWLPMHAIETTKHKIALILGRFSVDDKDISKYSTECANYLGSINPSLIYESVLIEARSALDSGDYEKVLRIFNKKDVLNKVKRFFGITQGTYAEKVMEMAKRNLGDVPKNLALYMPVIES